MQLRDNTPGFCGPVSRQDFCGNSQNLRTSTIPVITYANAVILGSVDYTSTMPKARYRTMRSGGAIEATDSLNNRYPHRPIQLERNRILQTCRVDLPESRGHWEVLQARISAQYSCIIVKHLCLHISA